MRLPTLFLVALPFTPFLGAQTLVGTYTVSYLYNAAGCPPGDGNPYFCPSPIAPGPIFINAPTPGNYRIETIANTGGFGERVWVGTAAGGTQYGVLQALGATLDFNVAPGQNIVFYAWDWYVYDNPDFKTTVKLYKSSCSVSADVQPLAGTPYSRDGKPLTMNATFAPKDSNGAPIALADKATACGFTEFNWQQEIVSIPSPSPFFPVHPADAASANLSADGSLKAPPPFLDPLPEGYQYETPQGEFKLEYFDSNPYYLSRSELGLFFNCNLSQFIPTETTNALNFQDCPGDYALPGGAAIKFQTSLVGVCGSGATAAACNGLTNGSPSTPLFTWNWSTTFNGSSKRDPSTGTGGVAQLKSMFPLDPNSGIGGVTITDIDSTQQTPPATTCISKRSTLWPPNGKVVDVIVSGTVTVGTQPVPPMGSTYEVTDSYGQVQPSGNFVPDGGGSYSFSVPLVASRRGDDLGGRTYGITVSTKDTIGNVGTCSIVVTVPHDQRN